VSQNTRQLAQNYNKINQQVSELNQEQSSIERTAADRRNNMQSLGVEVQS
jgi:prefoldin subunit 5